MHNNFARVGSGRSRTCENPNKKMFLFVKGSAVEAFGKDSCHPVAD